MITVLIDDFEGHKMPKAISEGVCKNIEEGGEHTVLLVEGECLRCWERQFLLLKEIGDASMV